MRLPDRSPSSTAPGRPILARPQKKVSRAVGRALHTVGLCCARLGRLERKPILQKGQDGSPIECQRPRQRFRGANKKKEEAQKTQEKNKALASVETLASKSPGLAGGLVVPSAQVRQRARHERATDAERRCAVSAAPKSSRKSTEGQQQAHKGHRLREARDGRRWTVALRYAREMSGAGPAGPKMRARRSWGPTTAAAVRRR